MRYHFLFLLCLSFATSILAQEPCGTTVPNYYQQHYRDLLQQTQSTHGNRAATLYVPVFYHLIGETSGRNTKKLQEVLQSHCELNKAYEIANIQFYIVGIDSIFNDSYYEFGSTSTGDFIMSNFNVNNVCNIYSTKDPRGVCGYAFFPGGGPNGGGIFLNNSCYGTGSTTLVHEMGHYLGLLHTFERFAGVEFVNGSNCTDAGDYFCDTPADFIGYRWSCPYNGTDTDPNGDLYKTVLDGSLYMSYSNDNCQSRFSPMQREHMYTTLQNDRSELLNQTSPNLSQLDTAHLLYPLLTDTPVNPALVVLRWNKVANATHYLFQLTSNAPNFVYKDTLLTDTFFVTKNLNRNWIYKYRVKPFSYEYTCTPYNVLNLFRTARFVVTPTIENAAACKQDGNVSLSLSFGITPFTFLWSDGSQTNTRTNLAAGSYRVTVTDSLGAMAITTINIGTSPPLSSTFTGVGNSLLVKASGGSPPYSYLWSDGSTNETSFSVQAGNYIVTITDSRGCAAIAQTTTNSIAINAPSNGFQFFPNPTIAGQKIALNFFCAKAETLYIRVFSTEGRLVLQQKTQAETGANSLPLVADMTGGIYILEIETSAGLGRSKWVVE